MKLAIMQPTFNPWLGYFDLIDKVDKFIFLDTVQLDQHSCRQETSLKYKIKFMFSILIKTQTRSNLLIKDTLINFDQFDFEKLLKTLDRNYKKSQFFHEFNNFLKDLILYDTKYLSRFNVNIIKEISLKLNFNTEIISLSETNFKTDLSKSEKLIEICKFFNATTYISPIGSKNYLDEATYQFSRNNLSLMYHHYNHPIYRQLGKNFVSNIGIIDLLYNEGFENSSMIVKSGRVNN